jgi:hypothetical protein
MDDDDEIEVTSGMMVMMVILPGLEVVTIYFFGGC